MFRGREQSHPERGRDLLMRLAEDVKELGQIESPPLQDGRNMVMVLGPNKSVGQAAQTQDQPEAVAEPKAVRGYPSKRRLRSPKQKHKQR